jgi:hypothetical protein
VSASRRAETASRATVRIGAALVLSILAQASANAANVSTSSCAGQPSFNCTDQSGAAGNPYIRIVPEPVGDNARGQLAARDRRWVDHCHPVIQYDRYGVARYRYSANGCEFGMGAE